MSLSVDLWSTGHHGYVVQRPLVEALIADGRADLRAIFCDETSGVGGMKALPVPQCTTTGTRSIKQIPMLLLQIIRTRSHLKQFYAKSDHVRIVHITMSSPWDIFYLDIAKRSGAKILLVIHDPEPHSGEESWLIDQVNACLISMADHIAVLTPHAGKVLQKRLGTEKPVHIVSPGLVMNSSPPGAAKQWPEGRSMRFLFFGRIYEYKGLDLLLDAWAQFKARPDAPPATLSIIGSGDLAPYQKALNSAQDVIVEHGWVTDERMEEAFATHDVNILPYLDGWESATALAGMWAGMPSIATNIGCFAEKLFDRENALIVDIDVSAIANAVYEISSSRMLYEQLAVGTERISQSWRASAVANNWINIYNTMLRQ